MASDSSSDADVDETTVIVLNNFAHIVSSFLNIIQDPNNPTNIAENVGSMVTDLGHILAQALKSSMQECGIPANMPAPLFVQCTKKTRARAT